MNLYKGKYETLGRGNYRGFKLTDQVMKLLERIIEFYICEMVKIDEMQFGFVPGSGATDVMAMYNRPRPVSNQSQTFRYLTLERKEGLGRQDLNV